MARNATRLLARFIAYLQQVLLLLRSALNKATTPGSLYQSMGSHSGKSWFIRVGFLRNRSVGLLALGLLLNVTQVQAQGTIPLQKGMAVLSCFSGIVPNSSDNGAQQNPNGPVLAIFDIRDPQGNGAPFSPVNIWAAPTTGAYHPANWSAANMGELFGVALEEGATSPAIFASTTGITATALMNLAPKTGGTGGEVFRVNGTTGAVTTLATLPNTTYNFSGASNVFTRYVGLGDITYNRTHNVVYVSNLDNGLVYAISATTGALLGTPFNHNTALADNASLPFTQFERMVFGVVYRVEDNKLYYAVKAPGPNSNSFLNDNQIYTVNINPDGSINAATKSAAPVITFSPTNNGYGSMVSDMALSSNGSQMLIAEMTLEYQTDGAVTALRKQAHNANVYKYSYAGGAWAQSLSYVGQIGVFGSVRGNSAGGVDFGFNNYGANSAGTNRDDAAVITADQVLSLPGQQAFGFQISNIVSPNTYATAYVVDLDGATGIGDNDKFTSGDIEVFGEICDPPAFTLTQTAPGCSPGSVPNNDGTISLTAASNATHYGISTLDAVTYDGPAFAGATAVPGSLPAVIKSAIPNTGGTYIIRVFNAADDCYLDQTVTVAEVSCIPATDCNCTYYMYLNEPQSGSGLVHKFKINSSGSFVEKPNGVTGTFPWFDNPAQLPSPHGLGQDLNGRIYIGETAGGDIRRLTCDGTISTEATFKIADGGYNFTSKDGFIYVNSTPGSNRITRYEICSGAEMGYVELNGPSTTGNYGGNEDWGLSIADDGKFYVTYGFGAGSTAGIFRFTPTEADFTNHTTYNRFITESSYPAAILSGNFWYTWGITTDAAGNMYVVVDDRAADRTYILKYNAAGTLVDSAYDGDGNTTGFQGARGIIYHEPTNMLYLGARQGDCVAKVNPANLNYVGAAVAHVANQDPKALSIVRECCPVAALTATDTILCNVNIGDKYFIETLIGGNCNAPICGGIWTSDAGNAGITFDECDNSFTVDAIGQACLTFTKTSTGGANSECGAFVMTVSVCLKGTITNPSPAQTFCENTAGSNITVQSNSNGINGIRFVRFNTDQTANNGAETAVELAAIYTGGTTLATVTPVGAAAPYTATLTTAAANWSNLASGVYYVYAILNPAPGSTCRPVQEIIVNIVDLPVVTTIPGNICVGATINLATLVTGNTPAGTLSYYTSSAAANAASNPLANTTVAPSATTTYYVRSQINSLCYTIAPITVNVNGLPDFSVINGSICQGGSINLATLVTNTSGGTLSYHTSLAAAQSGAPALAPIMVSPTSATNYYVRSTNGSGCYLVKELTVSILPQACGTIQITGPNNN